MKNVLYCISSDINTFVYTIDRESHSFMLYKKIMFSEFTLIENIIHNIKKSKCMNIETKLFVTRQTSLVLGLGQHFHTSLIYDVLEIKFLFSLARCILGFEISLMFVITNKFNCHG